jgi:ABC-type multidrug transport system fused ATPase/permease subunit
MGFDTCEDYWTDFADDMQQRSFQVGAMWAGLLVNCLIGFTLMFVGFGRASERLSKRVRNDAFTALVRQEIAFFDKRSVGKITSELQDDAARIHAFSGVPIRSALLALSSVLTGLVISFVVRYRLISPCWRILHAITLWFCADRTCLLVVHVAFRSSGSGMHTTHGLWGLHGNEEVARGGSRHR